MEMREEYSTGKAVKMLGIHFVTLKWIYAGKVEAIKTLGDSTASQKARYDGYSGSQCRKTKL